MSVMRIDFAGLRKPPAGQPCGTAAATRPPAAPEPEPVWIARSEADLLAAVERLRRVVLQQA